MQADSLPTTNTPRVAPKTDSEGSRGRQLAWVIFLALVLSSVANHCLAYWLGLTRDAPWTRSIGNYRRIGPKSGPQVLCAGSSLLVSGLAWPEVSDSLGQGIEDWTVAGSSPEVWEVFQQRQRNSSATIIGVSMYDLNEARLTPDRARYVPLAQTISDLWASGTGAGLSRRILTQYAMVYVQFPYPLAGDADKVQVAVRRKATELLGLHAKLGEHEGVVVEQDGVLNVEDARTTVDDWPSDRVLRRLAALRADNHDSQQFSNGPKSQAFRRVLSRAQQQGRVFVVVMPISQPYVDTFLNKATIDAFEKELTETMAAEPKATLVRLDQVPGISDGKYFFDLVHLNSAGRHLVTPVFLKKVAESTSARNSRESSAPPNSTPTQTQSHIPQQH